MRIPDWETLMSRFRKASERDNTIVGVFMKSAEEPVLTGSQYRKVDRAVI